jgi:hypothetical protein
VRCIEDTLGPTLVETVPGDTVRSDLVSRVRKELEQAATGRTVVTYGQLGSRVGVDLDDPAARTVLSSVLGEISDTEVKNGRPMLSVLVVQSESQVPGPGFFALGQLLSQVHDGEDQDTFAFRQMRTVWDQYASSADAP